MAHLAKISEAPVPCPGRRLRYKLPPSAAPIDKQDIKAAVLGLRSPRIYLERFQTELQTFFGSDYTGLFSSGRAALASALRALHRLAPDRHQVIFPAYTCWSVPAAILRANLTPIPCEVAPGSFDFDYNVLTSLLGGSTLAVVCQHLFGVPAQIKRLRHLLQVTGVFLIEDAAQAMGAQIDGRWLGTLGDIGLFSLGRGKNLSTVEGGVLLSSHESVISAIKEEVTRLPGYNSNETVSLLGKAILMALFLSPRRYWVPSRLTWLKLGETIFDPAIKIATMSGVQAGLGRNWHHKLFSFHKSRKIRAKFFLSCLEGSRMETPVHLTWAGNGPRLPILVPDDYARQSILRASARRGLGVATTYPDSVDGIPFFRQTSEWTPHPQASLMARQTITLPIHPLVAVADLLELLAILRYWL